MRARFNLNPDEFPVNSFDLIEVLDQKYPEKCWQPGEDLNDQIFYAGKRALVKELIAIIDNIKKQHEEVD